MAFVLGQKHFNANENVNNYMDYVTNVSAADYSTGSSQSGGVGLDTSLLLNEGSFAYGTTYYVHLKIKKISTTSMTFNVKLINETGELSQLIKTIIVSKGDSGAEDISFTFTPLINNFNCLLFELQRKTSSDQSLEPKAAYIELSKINNCITDLSNDISDIVKLGVQASPRFQMCINGEDIRTSLSGLQELRNGVVSIKSFSVVAPSITSGELEINITDQIRNGNDSVSYCNVMSDREREVSAYTVDYIYKK